VNAAAAPFEPIAARERVPVRRAAAIAGGSRHAGTRSPQAPSTGAEDPVGEALRVGLRHPLALG
jgi:hypothetical protein